jgi:hypothetical protein
MLQLSVRPHRVQAAFWPGGWAPQQNLLGEVSEAAKMTIPIRELTPRPDTYG